MCPRVFVTAGLAVALASPAEAQIEVTASLGWTVSSGVSSEAIDAPDGNRYDRVEPVESASFAFTIGYLARSGGEVGFQWSRQLSELQLGGSATTTVGDMNVDNYHAYFAYNFGAFDASVRPYVMIGLGATRYGGVEFDVAGAARTVPGSTRLSTTWGTGVKMYAGPNRNIGFKAGIRWTPTYISSDAGGWWCDPFWGCYLVGEAKYSHQFEVSGGIAFTFGT